MTLLILIVFLSFQVQFPEFWTRKKNVDAINKKKKKIFRGNSKTRYRINQLINKSMHVYLPNNILRRM